MVAELELSNRECFKEMIREALEHKSLLFAMAVGIVAASACYAMGLFSRYEYRSDIFLGEFASENSVQPFEPATTTELFVQDTLFFAPPTDEMKKQGVSDIRSNAIVTLIEAGRFLRIRSLAAEDEVARIKAIHRFIADGVIERLAARAGFVKARLENRLSEARERLKVVSNSLAILSEIASDAKASEVKLQELVRKLADESRLEQPQPHNADATTAAREDGVTLSRHGHLGMYQRLGIAELPTLRAESAKNIADLGQRVVQLQLVELDLTNQLAAFRDPEMTQFMVRSTSPVGPPALLLVMVVFAAGAVSYVAARIVQKAAWTVHPALRALTGSRLWAAQLARARTLSR